MKNFFRAMGDPTRRQILDLLKEKDRTAGEIADFFRISKPSISYHLDLLKNADLVFADKRGQYVYYSLNTSVLDEVIGWLIELNTSQRKTNSKPNKS